MFIILILKALQCRRNRRLLKFVLSVQAQAALLKHCIPAPEDLMR